MDEISSTTTHTNPAIHPLNRNRISHRLKTLREALHLTEKDVAARLRFSVNTILAIENGKIMDTPSTIFTRGYLRAYAQFLSLPEEEIQFALTSWENNGLASNPAPITPDTPSVAFKKERRRLAKDRHLQKLTYLIVITLTALMIVWWQSHPRYAATPETRSIPPSPLAQRQPVTPAVPAVTLSPPNPSTPILLAAVAENNKPVTLTTTKITRPLKIEMALPEPDN